MKRRTWKWGIGGVVVILVGMGLLLYWRHQTLYPSTSDAYVHAHVVRIAPQVTGQVKALRVHDNQMVRAGELLLEIDSAPFQIALNRAEANLDATRQEVSAAEAAVAAAKAQVDQRQAELQQAQEEENRVLPLVKKHLLPPSEGDRVRDTLKAAKAQLDAARSELDLARRKLGRTGPDNAQLRAAQASVAQARLDLRHTRITAPADGTIADLDIRPGAVAQANTPLFALVESHDWWVDANYEETALDRIKPGQSATIQVDMYPNRTFHGVVESLSPASGVAFSLLPPENATGNWVKVTQRFPVRVAIHEPDPLGPPLRVGASAEVTIDTVSPSKTGLNDGSG